MLRIYPNSNIKMYKYLIEFFNLLNLSQKVTLFRLQILIILSSLMETFSVLSIGPFMAIASNSNLIFENDFTNQLYSFLSFTSTNSFLIFLGFSILVVMIFSTALSVLTTWRLAIFGGKIGSELSNRMYLHHMNQSWIFHTNTNSSAIATKLIIEANRMTYSVVLQMLQINSRAILILMMAVTIAVAVPAVAIIGTSIFALGYGVLYKLASGRLSRNGLITSSQAENRIRLINESFGGFKDVLMLGLQKYFSRKYIDATNKYFHAWSNNQILSLLPRYAMELGAFGSMLTAVLFLLIQYESNLEVILPILSVFAFASIKMLPAFQGVYVGMSTIRGNIAAFENVKKELEATESVDIDDFDQNTANSFPVSLHQNIELKNICFDFSKEKKDILNNLSLCIQAKKSTGIVGKSGSGKSTAINIMIGLLEPKSGQILIDGQELNQENIRSWQKKIGFVSQNIFLIDSSIKKNIAFGIDEELISAQKLEQAIKLSQLDSLIESLPKGLDTNVGERGVQLSGGQLQRIGIARALYQNPEVIIFDEATSNLDGISEKAIMKTISNLAKVKTIIMIAHRLSTVKNCNEIFLLDRGELLDKGSYETLFKTNKVFKDML